MFVEIGYRNGPIVAVQDEIYRRAKGRRHYPFAHAPFIYAAVARTFKCPVTARLRIISALTFSSLTMASTSVPACQRRQILKTLTISLLLDLVMPIYLKKFMTISNY